MSIRKTPSKADSPAIGQSPVATPSSITPGTSTANRSTYSDNRTEFVNSKIRSRALAAGQPSLSAWDGRMYHWKDIKSICCLVTSLFLKSAAQVHDVIWPDKHSINQEIDYGVCVSLCLFQAMALFSIIAYRCALNIKGAHYVTAPLLALFDVTLVLTLVTCLVEFLANIFNAH